MKISSIMILMILLTSNLLSDQRSFVWTYEYMTMHRGEAEFEYYQTVKRDANGGEVTGLSMQTELEIGMTDRFDMGLYNVFSNDSTGLNYDGFKLRSRYRLGEKGRWLVDPLLYVEYKRDAAFHEHELELKLILGRSQGDWRFAYNPILEIEIEDDETEVKFEQTIAGGYWFAKHWGSGLEAKVEKDVMLMGPTISHGQEDLWMAIGHLFPIVGDHDRKWRIIIGIGL